MDDVDQLDLVELVHADEPAALAPRRSGFATEAWGVGSHLYGQIGFFEDLVAVKVRYRYLGGGSEEKSAVLEAIHVVFEFRKLPGPEHAVAIDDVRR